mmetsp:Transcript_80033/g.171416  ORF Transcript_80033/g.171416 Transcript_80033/m.171416 type:complete len:93 (-) Transcript_80033:21-299(-)
MIGAIMYNSVAKKVLVSNLNSSSSPSMPLPAATLAPSSAAAAIAASSAAACLPICSSRTALNARCGYGWDPDVLPTNVHYAKHRVQAQEVSC